MPLRVYIDTLRFALYKADNVTLVWEEAQGMTYGKETVQYLKRGGQEYFYGGALRNTYAPGEYSFGDILKLIHNEARFDCRL